MEKHVLIVTLSILGMHFLTSCGEDPQVKTLQSRVEALSRDIDSERDKAQSAEKLGDQMQRDVSKMKAQLDEAQKDRDKMEETLKKLDKEFSDYKEKYKVSILKKVPGYPLGEFVFNKKTYQNTQVRSVDDESITLTHPDGMLHVKKADLSAEMVGIFAMDQATPVQLGIPAVLKLVADHKSGKSSYASGDPSLIGYRGSTIDLGSYAACLKSVALLENDESRGSGFVASYKDHTYFFTNAHVLTGSNPKATIVSGPGHVSTIPMPKEVEISDEEEEGDIVRFELKNSDMPALKILDDSEKLLPGQKVVALGNSGGAGVVPYLKGKTGGIGMYVVEVDTPFVHGNSGGPVLWENSNTVIGIATRYDTHNGGDPVLGYASLPGSAQDGARRLCVRPEKIEKWRRVSLDRIHQESETVKQIHADTKALLTLEKFYITTSKKSVYGINYVRPEAYLYEKSKMAAGIAAQVRELEIHFKEVEQSFDTFDAFWATRPATNANVELKRQAKIRLENDAKVNSKKHFGQFVLAIDRIYGADVRGSDAKGYCVFNRKGFKFVSQEREDVIEQINKHFGEVIRQYDFNAS